MVNQFAAGVIKWRWAILVITLVAVGLIASGASNITFSSSYRAFFSKDNEQLVAFENLQNTYSKSDNVLMVIEPPGGSVFTPEILQAVQDLTERSWQIPYSTRVDSITNYQHTEAEEDDLLVYDLVEFPEDADVGFVEGIATNEPLLKHRLVSPQGHVTAVNATVQLPQLREDEIPEVVSFARNMVAEFKNDYPDLNVYITGSVLLGNAFAEASQEDLKNLMPIMFAVIILTLWFMLRSISATVGTVAVIILSVISAMGMFGWLGWVMTGPVASAPTVILTMAVADCVHILVTYLYNMRQGMPKANAMQESLRINIQPVFITSVTTVLGFMTMNFSEVPPFRDLGNTVAMGVVGAFVFSTVFLPALIMVLPSREKVDKRKTHNRIDGLANFVIAKRNPILAVTAVLTLIVFAIIPINKINDEFVNYFKESVQFRSDTDFTAENLSGIYTMQYSLISKESGGISDPQFLTDIEDFSNWLREKPEVVHVETLSDTFKRLNRNMHGDQNDYYKLPDSKDLAAQYLLLYEMSLPYGLDLNNQINVDKSSLRLTITLQNISSEKTLELEHEFAAWLSEKESIQAFFAASPNIMFSHIGKRNVTSMVSGVTYALLLICLIMIIALRSIKLGLLSLIPNLVPIACAFGIWAVFSGNVGISIGTAVGMILGIVVDDTVHFLSKYRRARVENNATKEEAVRYAFATVGTALWVTTFVLVSGFAVLALSSFNMNAHMGIFTACTIFIALVFDFLALPALLLATDRKDDKKGQDKDQEKEANPNATLQPTN